MDLSDVRIGDRLSVRRDGQHTYWVTVVSVGRRIVVRGRLGLDSWDTDGTSTTWPCCGEWTLSRAEEL